MKNGTGATAPRPSIPTSNPYRSSKIIWTSRQRDAPCALRRAMAATRFFLPNGDFRWTRSIFPPRVSRLCRLLAEARGVTVRPILADLGDWRHGRGQVRPDHEILLLPAAAFRAHPLGAAPRRTAHVPDLLPRPVGLSAGARAIPATWQSPRTSCRASAACACAFTRTESWSRVADLPPGKKP